MYRIRLASGEEQSYPTVQEFNSAVQSGVVPSDAMIYHARAERWLEINVHPHYQLALRTSPAEPVAAAPTPSATVVATPIKMKMLELAAAFEREAQLHATEPRPDPVAPPVAEVRPGRRSSELVLIDPDEPIRPGTIPLAPPPVERTPLRIELQRARVFERPAAAVAVEPPAPRPQPPAPKAEVLAPKPQAPAPKVEAPAPRVEAPAPRVEAAAPKVEAPTPTPDAMDFLVADDGLERPIRTSGGIKLENFSIMPQEPEPIARAVPAPVLPLTPAAATPSPARISKPVLTPAPKLEPEVDDALENDDESPELEGVRAMALAQSPAPAHAAAPASAPHGHRAGILIATIATLLAGGVIVAWRPWAPRLSASLAAVTTPAGTARTMAALPSAAVPLPAAGSPKPLAGKALADSLSRAASKADTSSQIVAAVKPDFKAPTIDLAATSALLDGGPKTTGGAPTAASPAELTKRFVAAQAQARQELDQQMAQIGFTKILTASRLSSADGVAATRADLAGATEAITNYRARMARTETAYGDSVVRAQRSTKVSPEDLRAWAARPTETESRETAELNDLMLAQVDKALALLQNEQGNYEAQGDSLFFAGADAAKQYTAIRGWVAERATSWSGTPESSLSNTTRHIARALAAGLPGAGVK